MVPESKDRKCHMLHRCLKSGGNSLWEIEPNPVSCSSPPGDDTPPPSSHHHTEEAISVKQNANQCGCYGNWDGGHGSVFPLLSQRNRSVHQQEEDPRSGEILFLFYSYYQVRASTCCCLMTSFMRKFDFNETD